MKRALLSFSQAFTVLSIFLVWGCAFAVRADENNSSLLGPCATGFANCTYEHYQFDMWETLKTEPCLASLVYDFDHVRTAEFVYLLHKVHIYQYPLHAFCNASGTGPISRDEIEKMFDKHTSIAEAVAPVERGRGSEPSKDMRGRVGAYVSYDEAPDAVVVRGLTHDSPAYKGGLRQADIIVRVDHKKVGDDVGVAVAHLQGAPGYPVDVEVSRDGETKKLSVVRETYDMPSAEWSECGGVGYIHLLDFNIADVEEYLLPAFQAFYVHRVHGIIFDVRGNPGGMVLTASRLSSLFLNKKQPIVYFERTPYLHGEREPGFGPLIGRSWLQYIPVTILMDHLTASASEMFAGALHAYDRAQLIGERSYGKGVGQIPVYLSDDAKMMITSFFWDMPDGTNLDHHGLLPDVYKETAESRASRDSIEGCMYPEDDVLKYAVDHTNYQTIKNGH